MVSHVIGEEEARVVSSGKQSAFDAALGGPASLPQASTGHAERGSELVSDGLGLVRGVRVALVLEAAAALCLYGLWHLWHFLR